MIQRLFRNENLLYTAAFFVALAMRLASIARAPLSDTEANLALQALALSKGQAAVLSPHPGYLMLTAFWMFVFGSSQVIARFWPAVIGSLLVISSALFKNQLGKLPAVLLAFFIAFDPTLVAISTQVGTPVMAIFFVLLFAGLWLAQRYSLAGVAAGLAVLSGPSLWPGLLGIGLTYLAGKALKLFEANEEESSLLSLFSRETVDWRKLVWFAVGTIFIVGTAFFMFPGGLSAMAAGLPAYLQGWGSSSDSSISLVIIAVAVYEFLLVFLGLWGAIRGLIQKDPWDRLLFVWAVIALLLAVIYPGRQVIDLAWPVIPLAVLAARQLSRITAVYEFDRLPSFGHTLLSALILAFISINICAMVNNPQFLNQEEYWIRLIGALIMLLSSTALIAWGWSGQVAIRGLTWGISLILIVYTISAAWNSANLSGHSAMDLWMTNRPLPEGDLLLNTINDIDQWSPSVSGGNDIVVVNISSPALKWELRNIEKVDYVSQLPTGKSPAIVITQEQPDMALASPYRGQKIVMLENTGWGLLSFPDWVRWLAFRVVPAEDTLKEKAILWIRADLFPGSVSLSSNPVQSPTQLQENPQ